MVHEMYHKTVAYQQKKLEKVEYVEFLHERSDELHQATKAYSKTDNVLPDLPKRVSVPPIIETLIDSDWNPKMELNAPEFVLGNTDTESDPLMDPIFPNEFTSELVQVLRQKHRRRNGEQGGDVTDAPA
jgi:hypothetical protein